MAFDENGLVVPRSPEIIANIQDYQIANVAKKFKYQNNKLIHQLNSVYSLQAASLADLIEAAFDSVKLSRAEGRHLEELGLLRGVYRQPALPSSTSTQYVWLEEGRVVPSGTVFKSSTLSSTAVNTAAITGDATECNSVRFVVKVVSDSTSYTITINSVGYTYVSDASATEAEIIAGILAEIDADVTRTFTYVEEATYIELIADVDTELSVSIATSLLDITEVKVYFYAESVGLGALSLPANTMDSVQTPVVGLIETNNDSDYTFGVALETDAELRVRIQEGSNDGCTGTLLSVKGALEAVPGVSVVDVVENTDTSPVDGDGRPIHSYECLVVGGTDDDVATSIWNTKPIGIELFGNTTTVITDSSNVSRSIDYSRPAKISFAVNITYTLYSEEIFPTNGEDLVVAAVVNHITSLPLGKDVIPSRMYGPIYTAAEGMEQITVEVQVIATSGDAPGGGSWVTTPIAIAAAEYAFIETIDVYIAEV